MRHTPQRWRSRQISKGPPLWGLGPLWLGRITCGTSGHILWLLRVQAELWFNGVP